MRSRYYRTGETCPETGWYGLIDPGRGRAGGTKRPITRGTSFPETPLSGQQYCFIDHIRY